MLSNKLYYNQIKYVEKCDEQLKKYPSLSSYIPCNNCIFHCYDSVTKRRKCVNSKGYTYTDIASSGVKK